MSDFLSDWFGWFQAGVSRLPAEEREKVFCQCGRRCAESGPLDTYGALFDACDGDVNAFFARLNDIEEVGGAALGNDVYEIVFKRCSCDLYTRGYISKPCMCECSRQSVLHVMRSLLLDADVSVEGVHTILGGAPECRFRVSIGRNMKA